MKNILLLAVVALVLGLVACNSTKEAPKHAEKTMEMSEVVYYACPMDEHKHVASKTAGSCEECGMDMVAVVKATAEDHDYYGCPMAEHSHVRSDESGTCADCGMALKPLKLKM